jgi:phosphoesterase RecJ-like protein
MAKKAKPIDLKTLIAVIRKAKTFLVATHVNPDGDGLGSILALGEGLRKLGKKVVIYTADAVPKMYHFMPGQARIAHEINPKAKFDVSFIVDLGEVERVGEAFVAHPGRGLTVSLDHHAKGDHNAELNYCLPKQASSGEVIFKLLKALKIKITKSMATNIYTAMVTDTGSFKYSNTTTETFAIAAELTKLKIDVWEVALNCFETFSAARMELLKRIMAALVLHSSKKVASITIALKDLEETGAAPDEAEGFINYPRSIEGVEVAIAFKETEPGKYKLSLRSKHYVDVAAIAQSFGGGGHIRAAGCKIDGDFATVREAILAKVLPQL